MPINRAVAKEASVSVASVSLVLNNHGSKQRLSPEMHLFLCSIADRIGYVVNRTAQSQHRHKKFNAIGMVFVSYYVPEVFFIKIMQSVPEAVLQEKWDAQIHIMGSKQPETLLRLQAAVKELIGTILINDCDENIYNETHALYLPIVRVGTNHLDTNKAEVWVDNRFGGCCVGEHVLQFNHEQTAISPEKCFMLLVGRSYGTMEALSKTRAPNPIIESTDEPTIDLVNQILAAQVRPVICLLDQLPLRFFRCRDDAHIQIPRQMGLANFDNLNLTAFLSLSLTIVYIPWDEMGKATVQPQSHRFWRVRALPLNYPLSGHH